MPRISAASVAEHAARQEARVFDAAIGLFIERGYDNVSLADIAGEVNLKRTSLYRYFPSKTHILLRWIQAELARQISRAIDVLGASGSPRERIDRWVDDQLDYAARPEHALVAVIGSIEPDLDARTRAELHASHTQLMAPLRATLIEAGLTDEAELDASVELISGLILAAARHENTLGHESSVLRSRLRRAVGALAA